MRISDWISDVCSSDLTGICYASGAGLPLDNMRPGEAILRILAEAATTLERSFKGRGAEEAADEYKQYWHSERHAWSLVPRLGRAGKIGRASCRERVCQAV